MLRLAPVVLKLFPSLTLKLVVCYTMENLILFVEVIGTLIAVFMYLSPAKTFWRIIKNRSTEDFESLPYVCTLLSAALWTYYGIIKPGASIVAIVNGFGLVVELVYVAIFLIYAPPKTRSRTALLVGFLDVGFLTAAILVTRLAFNLEIQINATGVMCAALNIVMYGSPLAAMKTVVTTKSVEFMPFCLSLFLFLNGGIWALYAILTSDYFLGVPNGTGFLLGTAQLVLYAIYWKSSKRVSDDNALEEASQHESLLSSSHQIQE